jgi:hypothetical protein
LRWKPKDAVGGRSLRDPAFKTLAKQEADMTQQRRDFEMTIARQQKQIEALTAGLQKVSAQLELSKSAPQTALNNQ